MRLTLRLDGLDRVLRRLNVDLGASLRAITWAVGELIRDKLAQYPGPAVHPIAWTSDRQRRFYFAMRRERGLSPAYTRHYDPMSQRLGPGWTVARYGSLGAKVASHATYAPFVQGADSRQMFHRITGWVTDRQAVEAVVASGDVKRVVEAAIRKALGG